MVTENVFFYSITAFGDAFGSELVACRKKYVVWFNIAVDIAY
jgi:hypothetical protein